MLSSRSVGRDRSFRWGGGLLAAVAGMIMVVGVSAEVLKRAQMPTEDFRIAMASLDRPNWKCGQLARLKDPLSDLCQLSPPGESGRNIFLIGNSHADMIKDEVAKAAATHGWGVLMPTQNNAVGFGYTPEWILQQAKQHNVDLVLLHNRWREVHPEATARLASLARAQGVSVAFIDPVPNPGAHVPKVLYEAARHHQPIPQTMGNLDTYRAENSTQLEELDRLTARIESFKRYPVASIFCTPQCRVVDQVGYPLYWDNNHLTLTGARMLRPVIEGAVSWGLFGKPEEMKISYGK